MKLLATSTLALAISASSALAASHAACSAGKTLTEGTLTIATGNPAYYPWVMNDAPESGEGFKAHFPGNRIRPGTPNPMM